MARTTSRAHDVMRRLIFVVGLLAVVGVLLSPWLLASAERGQAHLVPEAALVVQRSDTSSPNPPCPLSSLPAHRACAPVR